jgi:hypothetical protein
MIAIVITGRLANLETCVLLRDHLVVPNSPVTIFYYLENHESSPVTHDMLLSLFGCPMYGIITTNSRTPEYNALLDYLMANAPALQPSVLMDFPREFFYRAGAILEYYQFMKAYDLMLAHERESDGDVDFEVVVRARWDVVFREPMRIRSFFWNPPPPAPTPPAEEDLYVRSLGNAVIGERLRAGELVQDLFEFRSPAHLLSHDPKTMDRTMWTFYCNWIWIAKRRTMDLMRSFVFSYGQYLGEGQYLGDSGRRADSLPPRHCFNAENQFYFHLRHYGVNVVHYFTRREWDLWTRHERESVPVLNDKGEWIAADDALVAIVRFVTRQTRAPIS